MGGGIGIILLIACYFIPTIVAFARSHKDAPAIAAINLLLGWTVFGWFMAFIWALADPRGRAASQTVVVNTTQYAGGEPAPPPARPRAQAVGGFQEQADTAFWDSMDDRNDPDQLEEYLIRFPDGRFARLARNKLERAGVAVPELTSVTTAAVVPEASSPAAGEAAAPTAETAELCRECEEPLEPGANFCDACGAPVASPEPVA